MKWKTIFIYLMFLFGNNLTASDRLLVIMPMGTTGIDSLVSQSVDRLLRMEFEGINEGILVVPEIAQNSINDFASCKKIECACEIGRQLNADQVLLPSLIKLGSKIIFQYSLLDVETGDIELSDKITAARIEDLDTVIKRVAASILQQKPVEETAEFGSITEQESKKILKRGSGSLFGFTFGYLYPQEGYEDKDRSFTMDVRIGQELEWVQIGILLGIRSGFAVHLFSDYMLTKKDFCPYIGAGLGFHWVSHPNNYPYYDAATDRYYSEKRHGDGFEIAANVGVKLLRTFRSQLLINYGYSITFNDYKDKASLLTIGFLF